MKFRLKHGTDVTGRLDDAANPPRYYRASDPLCNIKESEEDLAKSDPGRWERISDVGGYSESDLSRMKAGADNLSGDAALEQARQLRELADALEDRALNQPGRKATSGERSDSPLPPLPAVSPVEPKTISPGLSIDNLSVNDLKALAVEKGIELKGAANRQEILRIIKESTKK